MYIRFLLTHNVYEKGKWLKMEENKNKFRNVIDISEKKEKKHTIKNNVVIPFISGVLGCGIVIGTCFGVPSIKQSSKHKL